MNDEQKQLMLSGIESFRVILKIISVKGINPGIFFMMNFRPLPSLIRLQELCLCTLQAGNLRIQETVAHLTPEEFKQLLRL